MQFLNKSVFFIQLVISCCFSTRCSIKIMWQIMFSSNMEAYTLHETMKRSGIHSQWVQCVGTLNEKRRPSELITVPLVLSIKNVFQLVSLLPSRDTLLALEGGRICFVSRYHCQQAQTFLFPFEFDLQNAVLKQNHVSCFQVPLVLLKIINLICN